MTTEQTHITPAMRGVVGRELRRRTSFPVSESDIRRWAIAVYYPQPAPALFWDSAYAASTSHGGIVAPEDFNPFAWMEAPDPDGATARRDTRGGFPSPERQLGIDGPELPSVINGGTEVEYGVRMRPGDVITAVSRMAEYSERPGRLGLMLFTVTEDTWTNQRGEPVKTHRTTMIRY